MVKDEEKIINQFNKITSGAQLFNDNCLKVLIKASF